MKTLLCTPNILRILVLNITALFALALNTQCSAGITGQTICICTCFSGSNAPSFTIVYSRDGQAFATAGKVAATGINNQTINYQHTQYI